MDVKRLAALFALGGTLSLAPVCSLWAQDLPAATEVPVESPLVKEPTTPIELFDATIFVLKLGKPELAGFYLDKLIAADPDDQTLLKIREQYGTATFIELTLVDEIAASARKLANRLQQAARNHVSDPAYFPSLLAKLSGSGRNRAEAIDELRYLGSSAAPALIKELQAPQHATKSDIVYALTRLGKDATAPMIGALQSPSLDVQAAAVEVLGVVGGDAETIWLQRPAFAEGIDPALRSAARTALANLTYDDGTRTDRLSGYGAVDRLTLTAVEHLTQRYKWPENDRPDGLRSVWSWDAAAGTVAEAITTEKFASIHYAEFLARDAAVMAPERQEPVTVLLAALMHHDVEQAGWHQSVPIGPGTTLNLAITVGPETCERTLMFAQQHELVAAQLVSLQALALNGSTGLLVPKGPTPPAVVQALDSPNPRVQFAAATTILSWEPRKPFKGNRRIVEIMARALHAEETPSSVVIDPNSTRRSETMGMFDSLGFGGLQARTGMDGFEQAVGRGDVQLAVVHPNTIRWELTDTIANLRRDSRTASLPIVIYGPPELRTKMNFLTSQYRHVAYFDEVGTPHDLNVQWQAFLAQISPPPLTVEQQSSQISEALFWLRRMSEMGDVFDLAPAEAALSSAANDPKFAPDAILAMAVIPTDSVQKRLLTLALAPAVEASIRQRAALQLGYHIQLFGNKLSNGELQQVATAATTEPEPLVQTSLLTVVGALKPAPAAVRKVTLEFPPSAAPVAPPAAPAATQP